MTVDLKNQKFSWSESFTIKESQDKNGKKWVKIEGMMVEATTSKNGRTYLAQEIDNQNVEGINIFMNHDTDPMNSVGILEESNSVDGRRTFGAKVRNTSRNPDVVEMVQDGLIKSVSIGATGTLRRTRESASTEVYEVRDLKIEELSLVGIGGIPGAGIDFVSAVTEKFSGIEENIILLKEKPQIKKNKKLIIKSRS